MYFSASAVNAAFDFDLGPTVDTGTSRALDNSFSNNNKHKNTNDLLKMKKDEVSKSNVGEGGEVSTLSNGLFTISYSTVSDFDCASLNNTNTILPK